MINSNQPELCEISTWIDNIMKWWKHHKRKTKYKVKLKRSGYYVPGNKRESARIYYLSSRGLKQIREYSRQVRPVTCNAYSGVPDLYTENKFIGIDTLSTYCMTNCMDDYINKPRSIQQAVTGISDSLAAVTKIGKGIFHVLDDQGMKCQIPVPELYYCSTAPYRIISPQHLDATWRQAGVGTFQECTNAQYTKIQWDDEYGETHVKTIKHTTKSGVPVCATAPSYKEYD